MGSASSNPASIRDGKEDRDAGRGRSYVNEAEVGGTQRQAKDHLGLLGATGDSEKGLEQMLPQSIQKEPSLLTP